MWRERLVACSRHPQSFAARETSSDLIHGYAGQYLILDLSLGDVDFRG